jgi:diphosphomevalonate decarboxylase
VTDKVTARAFASMALVKYWGKLPGSDNAPATPSISLTLKALKTKTEIERIKGGKDECFLNGAIADKATYNRLVQYLDLWRNNRLIDGRFVLRSYNSFPTRAGLASSSSGFAAMAVALSAFSRRKIGKHLLSKLARRGSGSAARSIVGGLAALPAGPDPAARLLLPAGDVPWGMVVVEVEKGEKKIGSREGMELCRQYSPYYQHWLTRACKDYRNMLVALRQMNFTRIGEITEANAMAMHACIIAIRPALIYWSPATIEVIYSVRKWRTDGLETYFTIDAGPNVVLLCKQEDINRVAKRARQLRSVKSVIKSRPGGAAEIVKWS